MHCAKSSELVACPICSRQIAESDINLHLDLQCPGNAPSSNPVKIKSEPSQSSLRSSPRGKVIEISDTPPRPTAGSTESGSGGSGSKGRSGNVASIFGPRKRIKLEDEEVAPGPNPVKSASKTLSDTPKTSGGKLQSSKSAVKEETSERKPKVNPLHANQPYVYNS